MIRSGIFLKFLFLVTFSFCYLGCNENSELVKPESFEQKPEISSPSKIDLDKLSSGDFLISFSESKARYLVTEQLARLDFPNDAIGETIEVSGNIVLDSSGGIKSDVSSIIVDLSSLKSDEARRDRYLSRNSLETSKFPEARFVIEEIKGMKWPLEKNSELMEIELVGQMTIHGATKPVNWSVEVNFLDDNTVKGLAKTEFPFSYFDIVIPKLAFILSVEDRIRLEFDFVAESKKLD